MSSFRSSISNLELDSRFSPPSATRLYGKGQFINRLISRHGRVISRLISRHRRVISRLISRHRRVVSRLVSRHRRVISWFKSRLRRLRLISYLGRVISRLISCFFSILNFFGECPIGGSVGSCCSRYKLTQPRSQGLSSYRPIERATSRPWGR